MWYQRQGETIVRELAASVSNPQTDAQMDQRVKLANVVAASRANKFWMEKYACENRKEGLSVYNAFVSANLASNDVLLTKDAVSLGAGVVAAYIYTKGTLPMLYGEIDGETFMTGIVVNSDFTTIGELSEQILAADSSWRAGDQLSIIVNLQKVVDDTPYIIVQAYEIIINTSDSTPIEDRVSGLFYEDGELAYDLSGLDEYAAVGVCCIHSRDTQDGVSVSTSRMILNTTAGQSEYTGDSARQRARRSYTTGTATPFLAGGYYDGSITPEPLPEAPNIVSVALGEGAAVEAGGVIDVTPSQSLQTMIINFADAIDETLEIGQVTVEQKNSSGSGPSVTMGQYTIGSLRSQLTWTGIFTSDNNISKVIVDFSNGDAKEIEFLPTVVG